MKNKLNFLQNLFNTGKETNDTKLFPSCAETENETMIYEEDLLAISTDQDCNGFFCKNDPNT